MYHNSVISSLIRVLALLERLFEIERSNHILLDRIAFQMENSSEVSELHHPGSQHVPGAGSLHGPKRKRELKEIASQNLVSVRLSPSRWFR